MSLRLLNIRHTRAYIASSSHLIAITPPLLFASFTRLTRLSTSRPLPPLPPHSFAPPPSPITPIPHINTSPLMTSIRGHMLMNQGMLTDYSAQQTCRSPPFHPPSVRIQIRCNLHGDLAILNNFPFAIEFGGLLNLDADRCHSILDLNHRCAQSHLFHFILREDLIGVQKYLLSFIL